MRSWRKGAKNSAPLPQPGVGEREPGEHRVENKWDESSGGSQSLQINSQKTTKVNEQKKKRMLTAGEHNFRESFPLFLCCVVAQFCVNKARGRVLRDSHLIRCLFVVVVLILGVRFSILSEKLLFLSARQYFNTRDCKFPRYRWCIYFFLYLF